MSDALTPMKQTLSRLSIERLRPVTLAWLGAGAGAAASVWAAAQDEFLLSLGAGISAVVCGWFAWRGQGEDLAQAMVAPPAARADASLEELAPLLEGLPEPALLVDSDERVVASNSAARRHFEFDAAGLRLSAILRHPDLLDAAKAAAADGAARTVEFATASQVEQQMRCYVTPVSWNLARAALMVFHDQTARVSTERMRADFLANASHELRTPLASLTLSMETILGPARDNPADRDRFLKLMQVQAGRMRRLIDDLLSLSRIEMDEHVPPSDRADLGQVTREVADTLYPVAAEREVSIEVIEPPAQARVVGERFQLAQVIQNLIDNAIKYSPAGGVVRVEVGLAASRELALAQANRRWGEEAGRIALLTPAPAQGRPYAYVRVEDSGPGIAKRFLPRLGERFFRVEREMGDDRGGTGLGLAIVKHIMNRHRGGLAIESMLGRGSAFAVYIEAVE